MRTTSNPAGVVVALALTACGGGGGSGGADRPPPVDSSWLQLTPSVKELSQYEGEPVTVVVNAKSSKTIPQTVNVGVIDASGTFQAAIKLDQVNAQEYKVTLTTSPALKAGSYAPNLEVRLCEDDPVTCAKPLSGSPWKLPLTLSVKPLVNLSTLVRLPTRAWSTYQGDALHSGYVPGTFDAVKFNRRWRWDGLGGGLVFLAASAGAPVVDDGLVFAIYADANRLAPNWTLRAFDEASGALKYETALGNYENVRAPAAARGKLMFMASTLESKELLVVDQKTGSVQRRQMISSGRGYSSSMQAPTPLGDSVYIAAGFSGIARYGIDNGNAEWKVEWERLDADWTPAADGNFVYVATDLGGLKALHASTGFPAFSVGTAFEADNNKYVTPVLSGKGMAYAWKAGAGTPATMFAVDLVNRAKAWSLANVEASPVSDGKTVYALQAGKLVAHDAVSGTLRWSVAVPVLTPNASLLVTDNHIFVSNRDTQTRPVNTVAIDLATQKIVWSDRQGGALALSDRGVLYLYNGLSIAAINLQ